MRSRGAGAWIALLSAAGLLVVLGVAAWTLSRPGEDIVATTGVAPSRYVLQVERGEQACQPIGVQDGSADHLLFSVSSRAGQAGPVVVTVDGAPVARTAALPTGLVDLALAEEVGAGTHEICVRNRGERPLLLAGEGADVTASSGAPPAPGTYALWIQLEDRTPPAWLAVLPDTITRAGSAAGAPLGAVTGWLVLALVCGSLLLALVAGAAAAVDASGHAPASDADGDVTRRVRSLASGRGALVTAAVVAAACGAAWALLTPPFQVPDEPAHYAYTQYLAETASLPGGEPNRLAYSDEQTSAMAVVGANALVGRATNRAPATTEAVEQALRDGKDLPRDNGGGQTGASPQPPLYYGLAAVPYYAASWAAVPLRVLVIRLFSVLMLAATAVLVGLLARELLPRFSWAPLVAGLVVALQPVIGFVSAGATPEGLMDLIAAAFLLASVRAIRRPSVRAAVIVAVLAGAGVITKITLAALVPPAVLVVGLVAYRLAQRGDRSQAIRAALLGTVALGALPLLYAAWTLAAGRGLFPPGAAAGVLPPEAIPPASAREFVSYLWQLYLPRVPGQVDQFGYLPLEETWVFGWLGRYGWLDYGIDGWVRDLGLYIVCLLGVSAIAGLLRFRASVWAARWELLTFVTATASLAVVIAVGGYLYKRNTTLPFEQARYLFPLAGLYGLVAVASVLGPGRRLRAPVLWSLVVLLAIHELSGFFLTLIRYYG